ncbi:MAG: hypothetical protein V3V08_05975 [Nannocystaceae bacterium]
MTLRPGLVLVLVLVLVWVLVLVLVLALALAWASVVGAWLWPRFLRWVRGCKIPRHRWAG